MTFSKAAQTETKATHQANLLALLSHRLDVAKANNNQSLVSALEQEYEQLTRFTQPPSIGSWLQQKWMSFAETLSDWSKVHIEKRVDDQGNTRWYAYNPQAGQAIHTESEADMHSWIKKTYWES
ncbi:MAG: hypothetical protein AAF921_07840 [Cyanobacteria bacterium P01_D01_bin.44]